jgi:protein TonB
MAFRGTRNRVAVVLAVLFSVVGFGGCSSNATTPLAPPSQSTTVYEAGSSGISLPTLLREVKPAYTAEAIGNRIQGTVLLAAVVLPNGTVGDVTVLRSLDATFGLDAQAVLAAKQWLFNPGMKDGVAVAVRVTIEMSFTLR